MESSIQKKQSKLVFDCLRKYPFMHILEIFLDASSIFEMQKYLKSPLIKHFILF